jgi:hypothetical protein
VFGYLENRFLRKRSNPQFNKQKYQKGLCLFCYSDRSIYLIYSPLILLIQCPTHGNCAGCCYIACSSIICLSIVLIVYLLFACINSYTPFVSACKVDRRCITIGNSINNRVVFLKTCHFVLPLKQLIFK